MPNITLADLLKKIKIQHHVPINDPILNVPLSLFQEQEHLDVITLLWLYGERWINPTINPRYDHELADLTQQQVNVFYEAIKKEVSQRVKLSNESGFGIDAANYQIKRSKPLVPWVKPTQVTYFVRDMIPYLKLMSCMGVTTELNAFLSWINAGSVPITDETMLLTQLQEEEPSPEKIQQIADALSQLEFFNTHPTHLFEVNKKIAFLQQGLLSSNKYRLSPGTTHLFIKILTSLATIYPITLNDLLPKLGITIPTPLDYPIELLLQIDLRTVPLLTQQQWPELIFYTLLFITGHAQTVPTHLYLTYSGKKIPEQLKQIAQDYINNVSTSLNQDLSLISPIFDKATSDKITNALIKAGLDDVHPCLMALICFENCNSLRNLVGQVWNILGVEKNTSGTIALIPSQNPFLFGRAICYGNNQQKIAINNHDLLLLQNLIMMNSKRYPDLPFQKTITNLKFFNTSVSHVYYSDAEFQIKSDKRIRTLQDPSLRQLLTTSAITEFGITTVINIFAITNFITYYGMCATNPPAAPPQKLKNLLDLLVSEKNALDLIATALERSKLLIDLDQINTLPKQIEHLHQIISRVNVKISSISRSPREEFNLNTKWLHTQNSLFIRLKEMAVQKQAEIEATHSSEDQENYSPRMQ